MNTTIIPCLSNLSSISFNFSHGLPIPSNDKSNNNHQEIAKYFIEKYAYASILGMNFLESYYFSTATISLHIHRGLENRLIELVGFTSFKNKLIEDNINVIRYNNLTYTSQTLDNKRIIITIHGKAEINYINYNISVVFVIKNINDSLKIVNHIFDIFF